jgi:ParB family protein of integrating conjugative element (PFGI_1 class)
VSCFDIDVSPLNQRTSGNPKYEEIRESIRVKGVQHPLSITIDPVSERWMLSRGGQTRLQACRELYNETGEHRFLYPPVIAVDYTSELDICIDHLIENKLRADNTFSETSMAVANIRDALKKNGLYPTQEALACELQARGLPVRRQSITSMLYLANELSPYITNTSYLNSCSRKQIDAIRSLRNELSTRIPCEKFDSILVEFVNRSSKHVAHAQLIEHIKRHVGTATPQITSPIDRATRMADSCGLANVIIPSDKTKSGFIVKLPDTVNRSQAELCFLLACLSRVFETNVDSDISTEMGLTTQTSSPNELVSLVKEKLELSTDGVDIAYRALIGISKDEFDTAVALISMIRSSDRDNGEVSNVPE